jgi:hypothetical protein
LISGAVSISIGSPNLGKLSGMNTTISVKFLAIRVDLLQVGVNRIALRGEKAAEGKRNKDAMVAGTIFFGVSGLIATSGKHYVIPEGAPLKAYVDQDIELPVLPN